MDLELDEQVAALRRGRGFVRPPTRSLAVSGADAERWLNDLVTAGVADLAPGQSARSLVLTPTGRIRADFHALRTGPDAFLLVQALEQPEPLGAVLAPYVLSSELELAEVPDPGVVIVASTGGWRAAIGAPDDGVEVDATAAERWRIQEAIATFPVDVDADSLPAEAGLDVPPVTDTGKGCFLGQESVARVRNLGHPTRVVVSLEAGPGIRAGEAVLAGGADAGVVTSVAPGSSRRVPVLARVRWDAANSALTTGGGEPLTRR
jgi:folate-binding protein YgfZ